MADVLERGRESFAQQRWAEAFNLLAAADRAARLEPADLERLTTAAYLVGAYNAGAKLLARGYREALHRSDPVGASRCALWLTYLLQLGGEPALAGGWQGRAARLLDQGGFDCVERGYLLVSTAVDEFETDPAAALATYRRAAAAGDRFRDPDLVAIATMGQGKALIGLGEIGKGMASLDAAMVAVTAGEVSPVVTGLVYCAVLEACQEVFDLRRAREWTAALARWCDSQSDLVPYRGQCLVHRAELMQLRGDWPDAIEETRRACHRLTDPPTQPGAGLAFYQLGELHRLRGELSEAEQAYHQAGRWIREPQPGLALLRLAQGRVEAAAAAIRGAVESTEDWTGRSRLLAGYVEIMLAAGELSAARAGAAELAALAGRWSGGWLRAVAGYAEGAVRLAEADGKGALAAARRAWAAWRELDVPYEAARTRVLMALGFRLLGDEASAELELDAATWVFRQLGAHPALARAEALSGGRPAPGGLTGREAEVLRLVAGGMSNRAIAAELFLSEKTVARHVSNILRKLGLRSRSAATAYAYRHGIVDRAA